MPRAESGFARLARLLLPSREGGPAGDGSSATPLSGLRHDALQRVGEFLSSFSEWCGARLTELGQSRSVFGVVRLFDRAVLEIFSQLAQTMKNSAEALLRSTEPVRDDTTVLAEDVAPKSSNLGAVMAAWTHDEARERARGRAEGSLYGFRSGPFNRDGDKSAQHDAVRTAAFISPKFLDQATLSELRLARIVNNLPSPNHGEIDRALAEADRLTDHPIFGPKSRIT